eukprot:3036846-Amphidinium_carterae.4
MEERNFNSNWGLPDHVIQSCPSLLTTSLACPNLWPSTVESVAIQLWDPNCGWQEQLALLDSGAESIIEIKRSRLLVCQHKHLQFLAHCLRTIRHH